MAEQTTRGGNSGPLMTEALIHSRILKLRRTNPEIHICDQKVHPRISMTNVSARICNVYAHLFELEYVQDGQKCMKVFSYADVISRRIEIAELAE